MPAKTYRVGPAQDGNFGALFEVDQTAASRADGWTVAKLAAAQMAEFDAATKQVSGAFSSATKPASFLIGTTANAFKTPFPLWGTFDTSASWVFTWAVRAVTASSQAGRMRMRVFKASADGSNATELTGSTQVGTTSAALSTSADATSTVTWTPGASITLAGDYLFFVIAWEITTASGSNSGDVVIRTGQAAAGSRLTTPNFTDTSSFGAGAVADNFNRANAPLAAPWVTLGTSNGMQVSGNQMVQRAGSGVYDEGYWNVATQSDMEVYVTLAALGGATEALEMHVRHDPTGSESGYFANLTPGTGVVDLYRRMSAANTKLASSPAITWAAGDGIGVSIYGNRVTAWRRSGGTWTPIVSMLDSSLSAPGRSAIHLTGGAWTLDDWGAPLATVSVSKTLAISYNVKRQVADTLALNYTVVGRVSKTLTVNYNVRRQIVKTIAPTYNVISLPPYASAVLADGPTGYWRLDDTVDTATDSSPSGYHLTNYGTIPNVAGLLPSQPTSPARGFSAAATSFLYCGGLLYPINTLSIETWVKRTRTNAVEVLFEQYNGGIQLYINSDGTIVFGKSSTYIVAITSVLKILDTNAHHIVVTRNGIGGAVVIYLDGVSETPTPQNPNADFTTAANNGIFMGSEWGNYPFDGTLDEFAVYPLVLTPAQVANHYKLGTSATASVSKTLPISYTVRAAVAKTAAPTYKVTASVAKTAALSYTVKIAVSKTVALTYNVKTTVAVKTLALSYRVQRSIAKATALAWNVNRVLAKTLGLTYNVPGRMSKPLALTYSVRQQTSKAVAPTYKVNAPVSKSVALSYRVNKQVAKTTALVYSVRVGVAKATALTYKVLSPVSKATALNYRVTVRVAKATTLSYITRAPSLKSFAFAYSVSSGAPNAVSKSLTLGYKVNKQVTKTVAFGYNVKRTVPVKTAVLGYSVRATVWRTSSTAYKVTTKVAKSTTFSSFVHTSVGKALVVNYRVALGVSKTSAFMYNITVNSVPVPRVVAVSYNIQGTVLQSTNLVYGILAPAYASLTISYRIAGVSRDWILFPGDILTVNSGAISHTSVGKIRAEDEGRILASHLVH